MSSPSFIKVIKFTTSCLFRGQSHVFFTALRQLLTSGWVCSQSFPRFRSVLHLFSFIHSFRIFFFLNLQCKFQTLLCANCDVHLLLDLVQRLFPFPGTLGTLPTLTLCSDLRSSSFSAPSPPLPPPPLREPTPPNSS